MNPSYNSHEKHLPALTYLWPAGKELNHTVVDTSYPTRVYSPTSGAQVTFPKSNLSLVKNPTSFLVKEKYHFINIALYLCRTHLLHPKEEKSHFINTALCLCQTHLSKHRSRALLSQITP